MHVVECISDTRDELGESPIWIEEENSIFYRDNPTIESTRSWHYKLIRPNLVKYIGVGGSDLCGNTSTARLKLTS